MFEIKPEQQVVLDWMDEVCGAALREARNHNMSIINRVGNQPALQYYLFNVVSIGTVTREQFVRQYPSYMNEATDLYNEYQKSQQVTEAIEKTSEFEQQLADLKQMVEAQAELIRTLTEQKAEAKPASKSKKAAKVETTEKDEAAEDDAESEA